MTDNVGNMAREKRRERILAAIGSTDEPQSAGALGDRFGVSRQVIVQDIAVLRAEGAPIVSTNRGYILASKRLAARVFKVYHSEKELADGFCRPRCSAQTPPPVRGWIYSAPPRYGRKLCD